MRIPLFGLLLLAVLSTPVQGAFSHGRVPDEETLAQLEERAAQAPAREQSYLYAKLVHSMVEFSANEYVSGDEKKAAGMLRKTQQLARRIQTLLSENSRRVKDTQILLRRAAFRLKDLLHSSAHEDRPLVQETLTQVNEAQHDAMMRVFKH